MIFSLSCSEHNEISNFRSLILSHMKLVPLGGGGRVHTRTLNGHWKLLRNLETISAFCESTGTGEPDYTHCPEWSPAPYLLLGFSCVLSSAACPYPCPHWLSFSSQMGFPSKTDSPSCEYSRFDFDSDEDFNAFFNCKWLKLPPSTLRVASNAVILGVMPETSY